MDRANMTNAEMEAEFRERNSNLRNNVGNFVNDVSFPPPNFLLYALTNY